MFLYESPFLALAFVAGLLIEYRLVRIDSSGRGSHPDHRWLHNIIALILVVLLFLELVVGSHRRKVYLDLAIFVLATVVVNCLTMLVLVGIIRVQTVFAADFITVLLLLFLDLGIRQVYHDFFRGRVEIIEELLCVLVRARLTI